MFFKGGGQGGNNPLKVRIPDMGADLPVFLIPFPFQGLGFPALLFYLILELLYPIFHFHAVGQPVLGMQQIGPVRVKFRRFCIRWLPCPGRKSLKGIEPGIDQIQVLPGMVDLLVHVFQAVFQVQLCGLQVRDEGVLQLFQRKFLKFTRGQSGFNLFFFKQVQCFTHFPGLFFQHLSLVFGTQLFPGVLFLLSGQGIAFFLTLHGLFGGPFPGLVKVKGMGGLKPGHLSLQVCQVPTKVLHLPLKGCHPKLCTSLLQIGLGLGIEGFDVLGGHVLDLVFCIRIFFIRVQGKGDLPGQFIQAVPVFFQCRDFAGCVHGCLSQVPVLGFKGLDFKVKRF